MKKHLKQISGIYDLDHVFNQKSKTLFLLFKSKKFDAQVLSPYQLLKKNGFKQIIDEQKNGFSFFYG